MRKSLITSLILLMLPASGLRAAITLAVDVQTDPAPEVSVSWNPQGENRVEVVRRPLGLSGIETWTVLEADATSPFIDNGVRLGEAYEYSVRSITPTERDNRFAHFVATLEAPLEDERGAVLLVVEETWADELSGELKLLELNLAGDGWEVERLDWTREGQGNAEALKTEIKNAVADNPAINSLFIFGAVEMVKSGTIAPDGHFPGHPHETDLFYADLDGVWTDTADKPATEAPSVVSQIPGDGVYDQGHYSSEIELRTGRVTFHGMSDFKKTEGEYLRDYIHKEHAYRNRHREVPYRNATGDERHLYAANATLRAMVDDWNDIGSLDALLGDDAYLIAFGSRTSDWTEALDGYQKAIFTTSFRSHRQQWWESNNKLRAMLTQPDWGLTALWGGRPAWYLHKLAAGKPIGQSVIDTQNDLVKPLYDLVRDPETGVYSFPQARDYEFHSDDIPVNYVTNNLLGDPTLRISQVEPVTELTLARTGPDDIRLSWSPSPATELIGYHVYSASDRRGPFTRLTPDPITTTQFDASAPAGADRWFQVRAVAMVTVPTGRYVDQSHGRFALAYADGSVNTPPAADNLAISGKINTPLYCRFPGNDPDGDALTPIVVENPQQGQLRWYEGQPYYVSQRDQPGVDTATFVLFDGVTVSEPATVTFTTGELGKTLLAWELPDQSTSPASPSFTAAGLSSTAISGGPGTDMINAWPWTDTLTSRSIGTSLDENADYFQWTVTPESGSRIHIDRINLGICGPDGVDVFYELRASTDGFNNFAVVPLERGFAKGRGLGGNDGILDSANTSGVELLQNQNQPLEFRLHFWHTGSGTSVVGIGKITDPVKYDAIEDISFIGSVTTDSGAPQLRASTLAIEVPESGTASLSLSLSSPPSAPVTATVTRQSGDSDLQVIGDGSFTFDADNWSLPQTLTFRADDDADATSDSATFLVSAPGLEGITITATEIDHAQPPAPQPDSYEMEEGATLTVAAPGVLANDSHPNGLPLTAELVTDVQHGELTLNTDGSFTYTPDTGFGGLDEFFYRAVDGILPAPPVRVGLGAITTELDVAVHGVVSGHTPIEYVSGQADNGVTKILGRRELTITGNGWFAVDLGSVQVDGDTILALEFANPVEGEIHGFGFDTDLNISPELAIQVSGVQGGWAGHELNDYASAAPGYQSYRIQVGDFYTGEFRYLFFVHDDDDHVGAQARYKNIRIFQDNATNRWAEAVGLDFLENAGMGEDANGDGKPNFYHFALAQHPLTDSETRNNPLHADVTREGDDTRLTFTAPFRLGTVFSGDPPTSAPVDGVIYRIMGDRDLAPPWGDLTVEEVTPALDEGLPSFGDFNQLPGEGWEYRTFRIAMTGTETESAFLWIEVSDVP